MLPVGSPGHRADNLPLLRCRRSAGDIGPGAVQGMGGVATGCAAGGGVVAPQNRPAGTGRALGSCRWFLLPARGGIPLGGRSRATPRHNIVCGECRESGRPEQDPSAPASRAGWPAGRPGSVGRRKQAVVLHLAA